MGSEGGCVIRAIEALSGWIKKNIFWLWTGFWTVIIIWTIIDDFIRHFFFLAWVWVIVFLGILIFILYRGMLCVDLDIKRREQLALEKQRDFYENELREALGEPPKGKDQR